MDGAINLLVLGGRLETLRGVMIGFLKYSPMYAGTQHWKKILYGGRISVKRNTTIGDQFTFWFKEFNFPEDMYDTVARTFFDEKFFKK